MARRNYHAIVKRIYMLHMLLRDTNYAQKQPDSHQLRQQLLSDLTILHGIDTTRYLNPRTHVLKCGNLHLAFNYAQNPHDHDRFLNMVRISPQAFHVLLTLIEDHPIFCNKSFVPQTAVEIQLAVTLFHMGRFGNGASLEDIARNCGISEGSVEAFTSRCFDAIESLHDLFVRLPTAEEKEIEKRWMSEHVGFEGLWKEGWVMYDGTIVVLYAKPGLNGDAYYTRKANYGLNAQVLYFNILKNVFLLIYFNKRSEMFHLICVLLIIHMA
jgi:hypothetical protein